MDATTTSSRSILSLALAAIAKEHGFSGYLLTTLPKADRLGIRSNLIVCNWPHALAEAYKAADIFWDSQLMDALKRTTMPISAELDGFARRGALGLPLPLQGLFHQAGMRLTLGFLLHDRDSRPYVMLFSGQWKERNAGERAAILYEATRALDIYTSTTSGWDRLREPLSARETDCIRWSAAGKSSEEIAIILKISIHTVNTHLKNAMRKLESANRMQAVATACRLRLI